MSLTIRGSVRARGTNPSCNGIFCRMVCLPRNIMGGFSRIMGRRSQYQPPNLQLQHSLPQQPLVVPEEWAFLASFEQQYGITHPFFYACSFMEALKMAEAEHKLMFMYLHSPEHPFTPSFCSGTLCSELVVQFLDANFVCWGAIADRGEGLQMAATLQPASFPFCAMIAPAAGNSIAVLQQMEGPVDPAELVEILQRTMEEQGSAFSSTRGREEEQMRARIKEEERTRARAKEEEKLRADHQLREEQDAAYFAALHIDQEKERLRNARAQKPVEASNQANYEKPRQMPTEKLLGKTRQVSSVREAQYKETATQGKDTPQATQILIRFRSGERREHSFSCTDKILSIYRYIDSLGLPGLENYRLISSFPRRVYGVDQMGMTLKDAGLHPRASLFLELL
ncbi:plant UBX domain-containing protein 10-like [Herrania umbratica]|uniref:Plant UBX domain-containing protein 10-like n=1 Tax=Herrania umbratica TaxID=108875 RepID=A0A6J1AYL4_9ROSI|nr:plant UBX domain-containing protein 10-like [Herrania umbratica]